MCGGNGLIQGLRLFLIRGVILGDEGQGVRRIKLEVSSGSLSRKVESATGRTCEAK